MLIIGSNSLADSFGDPARSLEAQPGLLGFSLDVEIDYAAPWNMPWCSSKFSKRVYSR